jgi:hypothetical protein
MTPEELEALKKRVEEADLRPEAKGRILELMQSELSDDALDEIKDLIMAEIEADVAEVPELAEAVQSDEAHQAAQAQNDMDTAAIQADLNESMEFFDEHMAQLDTAADELESAMTQARVEQLKQNLSH